MQYTSGVVMTYHYRNNQTIRGLRPELQLLTKVFLYKLRREKGENVLITSAFRTKEEQKREFDEGDSYVQWPYSWHNHGLAIDVVPVVSFAGWAITWSNASRFRNIADVAKTLGFTWGYDEWGFDMPHLMYTQGKPIDFYIKGGELDLQPIKEIVLNFWRNKIMRIDDLLKHGHLGFDRSAKLEQDKSLCLENYEEAKRILRVE